MYSVEQIPVLNKILYLRDIGFNVSEIEEAINKKDDKSYIEQLEIEYTEIERHMKAEHEKLKKIDLAKKEILNDKKDMHYNITIKSIPGHQVLSLRRIIPDYYAEGGLWQELSAFAAEYQVKISSSPFSIYHDSEYPEIIHIDFERGMIQVAFIDANDNTPVLDIKPYAPSFDRVETPGVPAWCGYWPKSTEESGCFSWEDVFNF